MGQSTDLLIPPFGFHGFSNFSSNDSGEDLKRDAVANIDDQDANRGNPIAILVDLPTDCRCGNRTDIDRNAHFVPNPRFAFPNAKRRKNSRLINGQNLGANPTIAEPAKGEERRRSRMFQGHKASGRRICSPPRAAFCRSRFELTSQARRESPRGLGLRQPIAGRWSRDEIRERLRLRAESRLSQGQRESLLPKCKPISRAKRESNRYSRDFGRAICSAYLRW